jgi:hypothetical protein
MGALGIGQINTMPIGSTWNAILKLLQPFVMADEISDQDRI